MTTEISTPPTALDADDLFALMEEYGGETVFDMMFETGDGVTDSGRMGLAIVIASFWMQSPTDVTDEQLSFLTSAVRRDSALWGHYYFAEPYDNVPLDYLKRDRITGKPTLILDEEITAAQAEGILGQTGGNPITGEHYDWAYRPEYYQLSSEQREYVGLFRDVFNPMLLGQAGLDAGDSRLDDAVLNMKVRNGHASEAEYRENGFWNQLFNEAIPVIRSGGLAADPGPWIPEQYGGDFEETQRQLIDAVALMGIPAVGAASKAVGVLTSRQAARAAAGGFTAQHTTRFIAAEHAPALLSRQIALLGSRLQGVSEAQWWGKLSDVVSYGYRTLAKRGAIITGAVGGTKTLIDTWRNLTLPQVVTTREDSSIMANVALETEQANFLRQSSLDPPPPLSLSSGPVTTRGHLTPMEDIQGVLIDETGRPVTAPPRAASVGDSDADITGEPTTATEYLDNPYVGFDDPRYFDFNADGTPQIEQLRRREFTPLEFEESLAGTYSKSDPRFQVRSMPRWHVKDIERELGNMTSGDLMWFQAKAVEAGLINPSAPGYLEGSYRDKFTRSAMESLMWRANRSETEPGLDWRHQLEDLARLGQANAEDDEQKRRFVKASYLAPDPAELANDARNRIRSKLGRDINDWELEMISEHLLAGKREQHEAAQDFRYNQFLAKGRAEEEDLEFVEAEPVDDVNWEARTSEFMEKRFGAEAARAATTTEVAQETPDLMTGLRRGIAGMSQ